MAHFDRLKDRITRSATSMFKHVDYPLAKTLEHQGDPGVCGPESVSWEVIGDPSAFVGGIRALLVQAAHPEVAAGVADHSRYRQNPLGRLSRTSSYITATTYGSVPEVDAAVAKVKKMHRGVAGRSHRDVGYSADLPQLAAWVHNALTESFLVTFRAFGRHHLSSEQADQFVYEQAAIGELLGAAPLPRDAGALTGWLASQCETGFSPGSREAVAFLHRPPLLGSIRIGYRVLFQGAVATIPAPMRRVLGVRRIPGALLVTRTAVRFLRWALGSSPSWNLALVRVGSPVPSGLFRQPLPISTLEDWGDDGSPPRPLGDT